MTIDEYVKMVNELETLLENAMNTLEEVKKVPCSDIYTFWQGKIAGIEHALKIVKGERD